jgi:hypothetical protein
MSNVCLCIWYIYIYVCVCVYIYVKQMFLLIERENAQSHERAYQCQTSLLLIERDSVCLLTLIKHIKI